MTRSQLTGITAALLLGTSSLAFAQASQEPAQTQDAETTVPAEPGVEAAQQAIMREQDEQEIRRRLAARGFHNIEIERDGPYFVGTARRHDEDVELRVMARTGRVLEPHRLSADQVRQRLEELGYTEIGDMEERNGRFRTTAQRFGEEVELLLSARTGGIIDARDMTTDRIVEMLESAEYENVVVFERDEDYGNFWVVGELDGEPYLLVIHPITGNILSERAAN